MDETVTVESIRFVLPRYMKRSRACGVALTVGCVSIKNMLDEGRGNPMVADFFYARALIWGVAVSYFALVMLICAILCNDHVWRDAKIKETCAQQFGASSLYGMNGEKFSSASSIMTIGDSAQRADVIGVERFWQMLGSQLRIPDSLGLLGPISERTGSDADPCDALLQTSQIVEGRLHASMVIIGLLGAFFLVFTGESAVQTTRFIVRDLVDDEPAPSDVIHRRFFPCLPWLYRHVAENIKVHQTMIRQKIVRINHDLKVPLAGLKSEASELSDTAELESVPELQKRIKSLERYANHIDNSADQLKLALGQQLTLNDLSVHAICLETMLRELRENLAFYAAKRDIEIVILNPTNESHRTFGNMRFAREMLMILLDNAVQYSSPGSVIEIELESLGSETCLSIKNTGALIPDALLTAEGKVLTRHPEVTGRITFNGVGLSIAAGIADLHRWKLRFKALKSKRQTVATLTLPKINFEKKTLENAHISS